jgi:hypothetical protein
VAPPSLADTRIWESSATDPDTLRVLVPQAVPMRRDPRALQRVTIDGAVPTASIADLADLRCWIDLAAWPEGPSPGPIFSATP